MYFHGLLQGGFQDSFHGRLQGGFQVNFSRPIGFLHYSYSTYYSAICRPFTPHCGDCGGSGLRFEPRTTRPPHLLSINFLYFRYCDCGEQSLSWPASLLFPSCRIPTISSSSSSSSSSSPGRRRRWCRHRHGRRRRNGRVGHKPAGRR